VYSVLSGVITMLPSKLCCTYVNLELSGQETLLKIEMVGIKPDINGKKVK
jgi:hypothetical protein